MKILILRFSSIGDIVLTTPVVRCLKNQNGNVEVHYCTKSSYKSLLEANPYIDRIHLLEDDLEGLIETLKKEQFDLIIDLHKNLRTFRIKWKLRVPANSFNKLNFEKWVLVNFKINIMPNIHIVERYMKTVEPLAVNYDGLGLDYFIPDSERISMTQYPKAFQQTFFVYAIGGQHETKKLPFEKMKELVQKITNPLILIGGKEDEGTGDQLANYGKSINKPVLNLCGKLTLNQSASVIQQSTKVYSHDTGMMHIAAALRKEIISIWGNTVPELGMYPFQTKHEIKEVIGLSCRPCSKLGYEKCPRGHFKCMNLQQF